MSIKLYYEKYLNNDGGNMGDVLTKEIFERIFQIPVNQSRLDDAESVCIGSTLQYFMRRKSCNIVNVWGTGFIEAPKCEVETFVSRMNFYAVRGKITKARIEKITGKNFEHLALGDPGLLAPLLVQNKRQKNFKLGIIPHYIDFNHPIFQDVQKSIPNSKIINIIGDPIRVIEEIAECETIASTSLHGLIVADSFGIPNIWCEVSKNVIGDGYKFRDYYSVYNINEIAPTMLVDEELGGNLLKKIRQSYLVDHNLVLKIQEDLIKVFPYYGYSDKNVIYKKNSLKRIIKNVKREYSKIVAKLMCKNK